MAKKIMAKSRKWPREHRNESYCINEGGCSIL